MSTLFDLDDFEETRVGWTLVPNWERCGLCGAKCTWNQGGTSTAGAVCDPCALIDRCEERGGRHVSHWGESHPSSEHDRLIAAQQRRRAAYLSRRGVTA